MCFAWAVLSALYPAGRNSERVSTYRPYLNSIDMSGLSFPVTVHKVAIFERNNPKLSINAFNLGDDEQEIVPKYVSKCCNRENRINLLLLTSKTS